MKVVAHKSFIILLLLLSIRTVAQVPVGNVSGSMGEDFWVTYFVNGYNRNTGSHNTIPASVDVAGPNDATITVLNYVLGTTSSYSHIGGTTTHIQLGTISDIPSGITSDKGWRIISTAPVTVVASNYCHDSYDNCMLLPTIALGTDYIVQDNTVAPCDFAPVVAMVALETNTNVRMLLPCQVVGITINPADTFNITLNAGQSLMLRAATQAGFNGMEVISSKPIALFQGHSCGRVDTDNGNCVGRDLECEQARPLNMWGTEFFAVRSLNRNEVDQVMVTAGADNCTVSVNGNYLATLQRGQSRSFNLSGDIGFHIVTSQPAYACLYTASYAYNTNGDPSATSLNPVDRWVDHAYYSLYQYNSNPSDAQYISATSNYINIVTTTAAADSMFVDEERVTGFTPIGTTGYCYARISKPWGAHSLRNSLGTFEARVYGFGMWVGYGFDLGLRIDSVQFDTIHVYDTICQGSTYDSLGLSLQAVHTSTVGTVVYERDYYGNTQRIHYIIHLTILPTVESEIYDTIVYGDTLFFDGIPLTQQGNYTFRFTAANGCDSLITVYITYRFDTIDLYDTICSGTAYNANGFNLPAQTIAGTFTFHRDTIEGTAPHRYLLHLTVLPDYFTELSRSIVLGDTLIFDGNAITVAGDYPFYYTAANGCDSTVMVHLSYESVGVVADKDGVCPGDAVVITATGTHTYIWTSVPPDPSLDAQQGTNPVTVHPMVTTTYSLVDEHATVIASVTVGTAPPPVPCVEPNRDILDFDSPVITILDCSEGRYSTTWTFDDGKVFTGTRVRRSWERSIFIDLPDSVGVTMTTCNRYNCCSDTTLTFPLKIRSIWFPNVFTPGADNNNLFGCYTSHEVAEYELVIFNRWGMQLWSTTDINQGWDGRRTDGTACIQGAYVYRYYLRATDGTVDSGIGTVTLLR